MKRLFILTAAVAITTIASAQIQFGVKAGLNLAGTSVTKQDGVSYSFKPDFHGGVLVSLPLFSNFSLQPEAMYSRQGSKIKTTDGTTTDNGKLNFGYINVPILFKYNDPSGFFAEIGPQAGFLLSANVKDNGTGQSQDLKSNLKSFDFSGVLGIGYLSSLNIGIDARYNLGFLNMVKSSPGSGSIKNGVIQIGIFYLFGEHIDKK